MLFENFISKVFISVFKRIPSKILFLHNTLKVIVNSLVGGLKWNRTIDLTLIRRAL